MAGGGEEEVEDVGEEEGPEEGDGAQEEEGREEKRDAEGVPQDNERLEAPLERDIERRPADPNIVSRVRSVRWQRRDTPAFLPACTSAPPADKFTASGPPGRRLVRLLAAIFGVKRVDARQVFSVPILELLNQQRLGAGFVPQSVDAE